MDNLQYRVRGVRREAALYPLVNEDRGFEQTRIAVIDGSIERDHDDLAGARIEIVCRAASRDAGSREHATQVASVLVGQTPVTVAICPRVTVLNFGVATEDDATLGAALAQSVHDAVRAGVCAILLTLEFAAGYRLSLENCRAAIRGAAAAGVRTIVPSGNSGLLAVSEIAGTPGVVPVVMMRNGIPHDRATLHPLVAQRGLGAPGVDIPVAGGSSLKRVATGSSFAAAVVAGAFALLHARYRDCGNDEIWNALLSEPRKLGLPTLLVPPSLDAAASCAALTG